MTITDDERALRQFAQNIIRAALGEDCLTPRLTRDLAVEFGLIRLSKYSPVEHGVRVGLSPGDPWIEWEDRLVKARGSS